MNGRLHYCCITTLTSFGVIALSASATLADGGTVRVSETHGRSRITVFTSPTPLRAGIIDVSVLVQDASTAAVANDAEIEIVVHSASHPLFKQRQFATAAGATNKLLRMAEFELTESGATEFEVFVRRPNDAPQRVVFQTEIAPPPPRWSLFWPWFSWPAAVVILYVLRNYRS